MHCGRPGLAGKRLHLGTAGGSWCYGYRLTPGPRGRPENRVLAPPLEQEETGLTQHPALGKEASARVVGLPPAAQIGQGLILPARASGSQRDHPPRRGCRTHPRPALLGGGLWKATPGLFYCLCLCPGGRPRREGKGCEGMGAR